MKDLQIFNNPQFGEIRTAGTPDNPLFCLADVCRVLDLQPSRVKDRLGDGVISSNPIPDSLGRIQNTNFVNEDGLYDVILDSRKPEAKAFRKWITSEVLPSIRKTGTYGVPKSFSEALLLAAQQQQQIEQQHAAIAQQKQQIAAQAPKVIFADAVASSQRSCLIAELAKILQQNGVNIGQNRFFDYLRNHKYLCSKGEYYNQPTQRASEMGLFEVKKTAITKPDGTTIVSNTTKVTPKGQIYFINHFLKQAQ